MARSLRSVLLIGLMFLALIAGCSQRVALYAAPTTYPSGVNVRLQQAYYKGDRLYVEMYVMNGTPQSILVDRDGMSLKLPSGQALPRSSGMTTLHKPYAIAAGMGHQVFVDFRYDPGFEGITGASVVLGGVSFGNDPSPKVVGELPLSTTYVQAGGEEAPVLSTPPPEGTPPPPGGTPPPLPEPTGNTL